MDFWYTRNTTTSIDELFAYDEVMVEMFDTWQLWQNVILDDFTVDRYTHVRSTNAMVELFVHDDFMVDKLCLINAKDELEFDLDC